MLGAIALLDACVVYPAPLRDFLMRLATANLYQPRWSPAIHDEWIRNLSANRPDLDPVKLERVRALMDTAMPQASVVGYAAIVEPLTLPDPDDRHVLTAAIHGKVTMLIKKRPDCLRFVPPTTSAVFCKRLPTC